MAAVLLWTGKAILMLLGVLLALVLLALVVPAGVSLRMENGVFYLKAHLLGVTVPVLPQKPKTAAQKQKAEEKKRRKKEEKARKAKIKEASQKKKKATKTQPQPEKNLGQKVTELLHKLGCIINRSGWLMKKIFGCLRISHVVCCLPVTGEDAAQTANLYGRLWAGISAGMAVLYNLLHIRVEKIEILPDYAGVLKGQEVLSCKIRAQLIIMVTAGVYTLWKLKEDKVF